MDNGELDKARSLLEQKQPLFSKNYMWRSTWALLLALENKRLEALRAMDEETLKFSDAAFVATAEAAEFYAVLEDTPKAVRWLGATVRNGDERVEWFRRDPRLASMRQDPSFQQIIASVQARRRRPREK